MPGCSCSSGCCIWPYTCCSSRPRPPSSTSRCQWMRASSLRFAACGTRYFLLSPTGRWFAFVSGVGAVAILGALAALLVIANWSHTQPILDDGATRPYARSSVSEAISRIPKDALIVSNAPANVYALTGRGSIALPFRTGAPTSEYDREIRQVVELFNGRGGGYVALSAFPSSPLVDTARTQTLARAPLDRARSRTEADRGAVRGTSTRIDVRRGRLRSITHASYSCGPHVSGFMRFEIL